MMSRCILCLCTAWLCAALCVNSAWAVAQPFNLAGPVLEVTVTRNKTTLPISQVPNLSPGDSLLIKADLPPTQSEHYLLVAAFLRGATNPPPEKWFFPCKTWTQKCATDGMKLTVPDDAQQVIVFLAPHTGGDLKTLISAVRGRPGAFVRTSQDLNQAALDRARLERYLLTIRTLNDDDPTKLAAIAPILARSLAIKVDEKCLDRLPELQAPCLMLGQESLILNDGHSTSIVQALTTGPGSDLAMEASYTPQLSYGYYSPYIASILDIARIFDSFRTAQYQYIPALASHRGTQLSLTLNAAPSFHDPKSVLVAALPAVEKPQLPPLHAVDPKELYCARKTRLILPVEGAPLVFSTDYAHDLHLALTDADGTSLSLPAKADPSAGGYVIDTAALSSVKLGDQVEASLRGFWGFDPYEGPRFRLMNAHGKPWQLAAGDDASLIVGRQDTIHLRADSVSCIDGIMLKDPAGKELKAEWKSTKPNEVEVKLPLQDIAPGAMTLLVTQYGVNEPQPLPLQAFAEVGRFDGFTLHAGDKQGVLKGSRLDEVASLSLKNVVFVPGELASLQGSDELSMIAQDGATAAAMALKPDHSVPAKVTLRDGRVLPLTATVDVPRPRATLINKSVHPFSSRADSGVRLSDAAELPQDAILVFSLRSQSPSAFTRDEVVDIATADESLATTLSLANGGLVLETSRIAVATLDPTKAFGPSAFGALKFRVNIKGIVSDWQPLANLVRLPTLKSLDCPQTIDLACKLTGQNLYLLEAVAADAQFSHPVNVPDGFLGEAIPVPRPSGSLYVKLRDNPGVINDTTLSVQDLPRAPDDAGRSDARQSALHADAPTAGQPPTPAPPTAPTAPTAPTSRAEPISPASMPTTNSSSAAPNAVPPSALSPPSQ